MMKQWKRRLSTVLAAVMLLACVPGFGGALQSAAAEGAQKIVEFDAAALGAIYNNSGASQSGFLKTYGITVKSTPACYDFNAALHTDAAKTLGKMAITYDMRNTANLVECGGFDFTADTPVNAAPAPMDGTGIYSIEIDLVNIMERAGSKYQYILQGKKNMETVGIAKLEFDQASKSVYFLNSSGEQVGTAISMDVTAAAKAAYLRIDVDMKEKKINAWLAEYATVDAVGTVPNVNGSNQLAENLPFLDTAATQLIGLNIWGVANGSSRQSNGIYRLKASKLPDTASPEEVLPSALAAAVELQLDFEDNTTPTKGSVASADSGFTYSDGTHGKALVLKTETTPRRISLGRYDLRDKTIAFSLRSNSFGKSGFPVLIGNNDSYTKPYSGFDLSYWGNNQRFEMQCGDTGGDTTNRNLQFAYTPIEGPGGWVNIAVAFDNTGKKATAYLNGVAAATINTSTWADGWMNGKNDLPLHIGNDGTAAGCADNTTAQFNASMDNFRIFSKVLTAAEVEAVHEADRVAKPSFAVTTQSADASMGSASVVTEGGTFEAGSSVTVKAEALAGHRFTGWTASGLTLTEMQKTANPLTFTMPEQAVTLTAAFEAYTPADGTIKFGVMSDHQLRAQYTNTRFERTESMLRQFKAANVELILVPGDITDQAEAGAYDRYLATIDKVYPPGQPRPEFLHIMGNHDYWTGHFSGTENDVPGSIALFKEKFGLPSKDNVKIVNGFYFIGLSSDDDSSEGHYNADTIAWLGQQLAAAAAADPNKPIFVTTHEHMTGTVVTSDKWGNDQLLDLLAQYPQVVHFSGHSHFPLEDERSIHQRDFTSIGTSAIAYIELDSGKEGGTKPSGTSETGQGMIVDVSKDNIAIERLDATTGAKLAEDWVIPLPIEKANFTYTDSRAAARTAPAFPQNAALAPGSVTKSSFTVTAPAAQHDNFVYSYRVAVTETGTGEKVSDKLYFSDWYAGLADMADTVTFPAAGLKSATEYTVDLYAQESFGKESAPISVNVTTEASTEKAYLNYDPQEIFDAYKLVDPTIKDDGTGANKDLQSGWLKTGVGMTVDLNKSYAYDNNFMKSASWTKGKLALLSNIRPNIGRGKASSFDFTADTTINPAPEAMVDGLYSVELDLNNFMTQAGGKIEYIFVGNSGNIVTLQADQAGKTLSLRDGSGALMGTAHTLPSDTFAPVYVRIDMDLKTKKINAWVKDYESVDTVGTRPALEECTQIVQSGSFAAQDATQLTGMEVWGDTAPSGSLVAVFYGMTVSERLVDRPKFTLSARSADASMGSVTVETEGESFEEGTNLTVTATAVPGHKFTGWTAAGMTLTEEQKTQNPLAFAMPGADVTLEAAFVKVELDRLAFTEVPQETQITVPQPGGEAASVLLLAQVLDQDGQPAADAPQVVYSLVETVEANAAKLETVLQDGKPYAKLSVTDKGFGLTQLTVKAVCGGLESSQAFSIRVDRRADKLNITGADSLSVGSTDVSSPYALELLDQYGQALELDNVGTIKWTISSRDIAGVGVSADGMLHIKAPCASGTVTLTAALADEPDKKAEKTVAISGTQSSGSGGGSGGNYRPSGSGSSGGSSMGTVTGGGQTPQPGGGTNQPGSGSTNFRDLPEGHWAAEHVYRLAHQGIITGDDTGNIRPEDNITREETVKVLLGALGVEVQSSAETVQPGTSEWAKDYMLAAKARGIIQGDESGMLNGQAHISRMDAMVIIARAIGASGGSEAELAAFSDGSQIPDYARQAVADLVHMGVTSGYEDGTIGAGNTITRAELFALVSRIMGE